MRLRLAFGMASRGASGGGSPTDPLAITNLAATNITAHSARLTFSKPVNAAYYAVYINDVYHSGWNAEELGSYIDVDTIGGNALPSGTEFSAKITTYNLAETESADSNVVVFSTTALSLTVTDLDYEDVTGTSVRLTFTAPADGAGYDVYNGEDYITSFYSADIVDGGFTVTGLDPDTGYSISLNVYEATDPYEHVVSNTVTFSTLAH